MVNMMRLSKPHRRGIAAYLLCLLLLCNGVLHLCFHEHADAGGTSGIRSEDVSAIAIAHHDNKASFVSDSFCPGCSAVFDWWCAAVRESEPVFSAAAAAFSLPRLPERSAPERRSRPRAPPRG